MKKKLRYAYIRLLKCQGAPKEIAGGLALGLFMAMLPVLGSQMLAALGVAEVLRRLFGFKLSRVAAAVGVWLTNPLTAAPLYGLCWLIGRPVARLLLPADMLAGEGVQLSLQNWQAAGPFLAELILGVTIGGILVGIPAAWIGYKLGLRAVVRYQDRRAARRARHAPAALTPGDLAVSMARTGRA